jgi:transposase
VAAFAALAGTNPIPASSGQVTRYRLNRGGDRQLNRALHTILLVRLRTDPDTRAYMARRTAGVRAAATPSGAYDASSPASSSGSWNAMTDPASRSSGRLDST